MVEGKLQCPNAPFIKCRGNIQRLSAAYASQNRHQPCPLDLFERRLVLQHTPFSLHLSHKLGLVKNGTK